MSFPSIAVKGTNLELTREIEELLDSHDQMLGFEVEFIMGTPIKDKWPNVLTGCGGKCEKVKIRGSIQCSKCGWQQ